MADTYRLFLRDKAGSLSFFSEVDTAADARTVARLKSRDTASHVMVARVQGDDVVEEMWVYHDGKVVSAT